MLGTVPVTINWQADTPERVVYKVSVTGSRLVLVDSATPKQMIARLATDVPSARVYDVGSVESAPPLPPSDFCGAPSLRGDEATRIVIFTSGTTGQPKGVRLTYRSYECNRATFEAFLQAGERARRADPEGRHGAQGSARGRCVPPLLRG